MDTNLLQVIATEGERVNRLVQDECGRWSASDDVKGGPLNAEMVMGARKEETVSLPTSRRRSVNKTRK